MPDAIILGKTSQKSRAALLDADPPIRIADPPPAGIYLHWPFCLSKCCYCNFAAAPDRPGKARQYSRAILREIETFDPSRFCELRQVDSLYWGGGTPSIMPVEVMAEIHEASRKCFKFESDTEITLEANPGTMDLEKALFFRQMGVNRVSLGVQSFHDHELRMLKRNHTARQAREAYEQCRSAGFSNVSIDLICGLPGQTRAIWLNSLQQAMHLSPEHISVYILELHRGTPLDKEVRMNRISIPPDEDTIANYYLCIDMLEGAGYEHYEISNFALPEKRSRHNLKYWKNHPYFGFGAASHSHTGDRRYFNESDVDKYICQVTESGSGLKGQSDLSFRQWLGDYAITALRLRQGIDLAIFRKTYGFSFESYFEAEISRLMEWRLLERKDGCLRLTRESLAVSNEVFMEFV